MTTTHYDNLKVARGAPEEVIRAAYRALCQRYHPDKNDSPDATRIMKILNDAYAVLGDPEARSAYDATLDGPPTNQATPAESELKSENAETPFASSKGPAPRHTPKASAMHPALLPLAGQWPRFLARTFDVWWEVALVAGVGGYWLAQNSAWYLDLITGPGSNVFAGLLFLPFALVLDALVFRAFGNTPGKSLLGLKVTRIDGQQLEFKEYLKRNLLVWISGLALGLPLFSLGTFFRQSSRLKAGKQASYDESSGHRVRTRGTGVFKITVFVVAFVALFFLAAIVKEQSRSSDVEQATIATAPPFDWANPITALTATVDPKWKATLAPAASGDEVYMFAESTGHAVVFIGREKAAGWTTRDYLSAYRRSTANVTRLDGDGAYSDDGRFWRGDGTTVKDGLRVHVEIMKVGESFWRIAELQDKPYAFTDQAVEKLRGTLWRTVQ